MTAEGDKRNLFEAIATLSRLDQAWDRVRANRGCAGGDGETIDFFRRDAPRRLAVLRDRLRSGDYRPRDLRVLHVPKRSGGTRPLAIPSVEDRIAQTACAMTLTPVLDPTFEEASFAYRPGRSVAMAVRAIDRWRRAGHTHVVEADIVRCFERIPHDPVLDRLEAALPRHAGATEVTDLAALWLEQAGVALGTPGIGLPQGSPLSPLLANLHLDRLDETMALPGIRIVRFADDFVLLCKGEARAQAALAKATEALSALGLEMHADRSRVVDFDRGFEFLGHLFVRSMALWTCLGKVPGSWLPQAALLSKATGLFPPRAECRRRGL